MSFWKVRCLITASLREAAKIEKNGLVFRSKLHDYQGVCQTIKKVRIKSAGFSLRPWIYGVFESLRALATHIVAFVAVLHFEMVSAESEYYNFENSQAMDMPENGTLTPVNEAPANPPFLCDMKYELYHSGWTSLKTLLSVHCAANCTK